MITCKLSFVFSALYFALAAVAVTSNLMGRNDWVVADRGKVLWWFGLGAAVDWNEVNDPVEIEPGINLVDSPCGGL